MIKLLTREIKGSVSQTTLFHPLAAEKSVVRPADEFLQLCSGRVDDLRARLAQNRSLNPKLRPHRGRHDQHTTKAKHARNREYNFLLKVSHCVWRRAQPQ